MGLIVFGSRNAKIGSRDVFMYECPFCNEKNSTTLTAYVTYYHIFWVPFFPYAKHATSVCHKCNTKRDELKFGPQLVQEYRAIKRKFKYPWWTWMICLIFLGLVITIIIVAPK